MTDPINTSYAANVNARHAQADNIPKTVVHKSLRMGVNRLISRAISFLKDPSEKKYDETKNDRPEGLSKSELKMADQRVEKWVESIVGIKWTKPKPTIKQRLHKAIYKIHPRHKVIISVSEADDNERTAASVKNQRKASFSSSIIEETPPDRPHLKPYWPKS
jgi:hypothetical protein